VMYVVCVWGVCVCVCVVCVVCGVLPPAGHSAEDRTPERRLRLLTMETA